MADDAHVRRIAQNEVTFRQVNEALEPPDAAPDEPLSFVCECGVLGCTERITLTRAQYEAVRTGFERFVLLPEHVDPAGEEVVEHHGTHVVVAKRGVARQIAESEDPRGDEVHGA